ncbi:uncharacterized protein T551_01759 [Pneumocystis jirovecii RU7]|uniref:Glycosylphosphatidylinositol anchor biosynthesis protein 11 n=1 Tax=Pneumocystis jirovecii (strain RU7) TaxID=1408657 RepID=A0A0W4ZQ18_PNEJ7|nr:uncharacterized protein T551_01759 [Pneumocystis jirovecii RU7]KTW30476.1 hypothetical protein T551_01759 [Pneumocystis jirovecii RU7]
MFTAKNLLEIYDIFHSTMPLFFLYLKFDLFLTQTIKTLMGPLFILVLLLQINIFTAILYFVFGCFLVHIFIIFYGAPVLDYIWETALCALHLTTLGILPLICVFGMDTEKYAELLSFELDLQVLQNLKLTVGFYSTFIGAWLGAIPIPLDWDRIWQKWPIPIVIGGYAGYASSIVILLFIYLKNIFKWKSAYVFV